MVSTNLLSLAAAVIKLIALIAVAPLQNRQTLQVCFWQEIIASRTKPSVARSLLSINFRSIHLVDQDVHRKLEENLSGKSLQQLQSVIYIWVWKKFLKVDLAIFDSFSF